MRDSSVFVRTRKAGDCGDSPINAVWYTGATNAVPVLELGNIVFRGATSLSKALGIGVNGKAYNDGEYKIPFDSILKGGSGVKIRACGTGARILDDRAVLEEEEARQHVIAFAREDISKRARPVARAFLHRGCRRTRAANRIERRERNDQLLAARVDPQRRL